MAKKKKIKILELEPKVFYKYRKYVKGNENITYEMACRKLTRNSLLGEQEYNPYNEFDDNASVYTYGRMRFGVRNNKVVWLATNGRRNADWTWEKDADRHRELSILLGIAE